MHDAISWDDQHVFLAVLEGGSLSAAARLLNLAQPTVRARLEALEQALGVALFTRSSQGLQPTGQAQALQAHARAMDHASRAFLRAATATPGEVRGTVRLSVAETVGIEVLPAMLAGLRRKHPALVVEVELSNRPARMSEQAADIAVRMQQPTQDSLVARKVGSIALGLFAHRDYLSRQGHPATMDELAQHDFIGPDRSVDDHRVAREWFPRSVVDRMLLRTDSHPAQHAFARAGLGIAVMHRALGRADPGLVQLLPDDFQAALPVWLVTHRDLRREPRVRAAFDHLVASFSDYCRA
ncbi:LysR family transcriptional regulator [Mitsuaria sp. WAJ17]|uniref:LysR family transcriptional regulator n=1 Tax=Mitsuaria sp. WAJ17 TaxID=2761452 RepID=UPI001602351E|nr:LysR family transcriptional regulator [Mitsuaria sp. WAJ17]MBB2483627.1 LysR family transcriptional regulator [Mitsuaria sp. WAJ17]